MLNLLNNTVNKLYQTPALVKAKAPSFCGSPKELESDCFVSSDKSFLNLGDKEILEKIKSSMNKENFLGNGNDANVYRINGTSLAVKVPHLIQKKPEYNFERISKIDECDKVNHVSAKFKNNIQIMKLIEGYPLVQSGKEAEIPRDKINEMLLNLPNRSFQGLFKQICHAADNNMIFDCSPQNIIINPKTKTLTAIDFNKMDPEYPEEVITLRYMFEAMNCGAIDIEEKLAGKIILGAVEELKPDVKPCVQLGEFKFMTFFDKIENYVKHSDPDLWSNLYADIVDIQVLKMEELEGIDVKEELSDKIAALTKIINDKVL